MQGAIVLSYHKELRNLHLIVWITIAIPESEVSVVVVRMHEKNKRRRLAIQWELNE